MEDREYGILPVPAHADTLQILKGYRDMVWGMDLSLRQLQGRFVDTPGAYSEVFLDFLCLSGIDSPDRDTRRHIRHIEQSRRILRRLDAAVEILRARHKRGELYYWLLYYTYLSPRQLRNTEEIIESLRSHTIDISFRTYYRRRREAVEALNVLLRESGTELA